MSEDKTYSAADIKVLTGLGPVRRRPGMYVGGVGSIAWTHMVFGALDDIFESALANNGNHVCVKIEDSTCFISDSSSFPQTFLSNNNITNCDYNLLHMLCSQLHYNGFESGKYYKPWLPVVRGLSSFFAVRIADQECGKELSYGRYNAEDMGIWRTFESDNAPSFEIEFVPDFDLLGAPTTPVWDKETLSKRLRTLCGIRAGFTAEFTYNNEESETFCMPNGLADLLSDNADVESPIHRIVGSRDDFTYELAFGTAPKSFIQSYANTVETRSGGSHVKAVKQVCENIGIDTKQYAFAISAVLSHPQFTQPVKDELVAPELFEFILEDLESKLRAVV